MKIQEGHLEFDFPTNNGSLASQYDEWSFYRNQFIKVTAAQKPLTLFILIRSMTSLGLLRSRITDTQILD